MMIKSPTMTSLIAQRSSCLADVTGLARLSLVYECLTLRDEGVK